MEEEEEEDEDFCVFSSSPSRPPRSGGCHLLLASKINRIHIRIRIVVVPGAAAGVASYPEYYYAQIGRSIKEAFIIVIIRRFWEGHVDGVQEEEGLSVFVVVKVVQAVVGVVRAELWY